MSGAAKVTDHSFSVWENGKKVVYNTTPELYQAFKMLNPEGANMFTKLLSYPAKWLRAGATLGPEFILRNPVRDMISATIYSKHGFIPVVDTLKGLGLYLQKVKLTGNTCGQVRHRLILFLWIGIIFPGK